jgi:hypothetical protein
MQFQLMRPATANLVTSTALKIAIGLWFILALAAIFMTTLGTDEAWVLNGLRSTLWPTTPNLTSELIGTNGGVFALLQLSVEWLVGSQVWAHRLVSLSFLAAAFYLVLRCSPVRNAPASMQWLLAAPLIAIPGVAEVGTAALGTSTGVFFMLSALLLWSANSLSLAARVVFGGLFYGAAASSRYDLVLVGPALLLVSCLQLQPTGRVNARLNYGALTFVTIGFAVFLVNQWAMNPPVNEALGYDVSGAAGVSGAAFNYPKLLNHWAGLQAFTPLALITLIITGAYWSRPEVEGQQHSQSTPRFESLLAVTGCTLLIGWLLRAPIPHLRYLFPALFCFATLAVICLKNAASLAMEQGSAKQWFLCQLIALACVVGSLGTSLRSIVMADSDIASWEWSREVPFDYYRRFVASSQQKDAANYINNVIPPDSIIYSHVPYALRYMTNRAIVDIDRPAFNKINNVSLRRYLVLTPSVGTYLYMNPKFATWLQTNAVLQAEMGRYSFYLLPPGGDNEIKALNLVRTNYEGHPNSKRWFGR